ncbi:hypothetical protein P0276_001786 [Escherichia coli]|nr:hypothetical protein [Escherichia coli]
MTKFISVKVFRGTISEDEKNGKFAGQPGACFRVATEDDAHVKCFHVPAPPFDAKHLEDLNKVRGFVFALLVLNPFPENEVELIGAEVVTEYKITPAENGDSKIERIK